MAALEFLNFHANSTVPWGEEVVSQLRGLTHMRVVIVLVERVVRSVTSTSPALVIVGTHAKEPTQVAQVRQEREHVTAIGLGIH